MTSDRLYYLNSIERTFIASQQFCVSKGMRLAIPRSEEEDMVISDIAMDGPPGKCHDSPWLGGVFNFDNESVTWLWNGETDQIHPNETNFGQATHGIVHYQNDVIDFDRTTCRPRGACKDAVRQAKSLSCNDGSHFLIWWRYPKDHRSCKSTSICELDISELSSSEKEELRSLSNSTILLEDFLRRVEGGRKMSISTLKLMNKSTLKSMDMSSMESMDKSTLKFIKRASSKMSIGVATDEKPKPTPLKPYLIYGTAGLAVVLCLVALGCVIGKVFPQEKRSSR